VLPNSDRSATVVSKADTEKYPSSGVPVYSRPHARAVEESSVGKRDFYTGSEISAGSQNPTPVSSLVLRDYLLLVLGVAVAGNGNESGV